MSLSHNPDTSADPIPTAGATRRRDLLRGLALGTAAGLIGAPSARGGNDDDPAKKDQKPAEPATDAPPPNQNPTEADARMALVLARYGDQLDGDARAVIRAEIEGHVRRAQALRKIPLTNGDGPFPVFHPYRAPLAPDTTPPPK
jgi:hypothetical protein